MEKKLLAAVVLLAAQMLITSCSNDDTSKGYANLSAKEKLQITSEVLANFSTFSDTVPELTVPLTQIREKLAINFKSHAADASPITEEEARYFHQDYLSSNPILNNNKVVHSLLVRKTDIDLISGSIGKGVRIYFLKEGADLSMCLVPVNTSGHNVLANAAGNSLIINRLDPCPDICEGNVSHTGPNHVGNLSYDPSTQLWLKPNLKARQLSGVYWKWVDVNNVPKK